MFTDMTYQSQLWSIFPASLDPLKVMEMFQADNSFAHCHNLAEDILNFLSYMIDKPLQLKFPSGKKLNLWAASLLKKKGMLNQF